MNLSAEGGAAFVRVLRSCSATLKIVSLPVAYDHGPDPAFATEVAPRVAPGLLSCRGKLERLEVPWGVFQGVPPTCPTFARLTHLEVRGKHEPIDLASPVWDIVAGGVLPALTDLCLTSFKGAS
jgi:hypothetical protein